MEHITTKEAAQYVAEADPFLGATITAHHLLYNRNAIFTGGIRPHYYCLPVLKRETHRLALVAAATSGHAEVLPRHRQRPAPSAPEGTRHWLRRLLHRARRHRDVRRGVRRRRRAGQAGGFRQLQSALTSTGLPRNTGTITLKRESWTPPESFAFGEAELKPLRSGEALPWKLVA